MGVVGLLALSALGQTGESWRFEVRPPLRRFSVMVEVRHRKPKPGETVVAPGAVTIVDHGGKVVQTIPMKSIGVFDLHNTFGKRDNPFAFVGMDVVQYQDFDFDGVTDFAICKDLAGYGSTPRFEVFLWKPREKRFVRDAALSKLSSAYSGLVEVNAARKELMTHDPRFRVRQTTHYRWKGGKVVEVRVEVSGPGTERIRG